MIDRVRRGLAVVRLQSGDLSLYSAIQEQIELLTAAGELRLRTFCRRP